MKIYQISTWADFIEVERISIKIVPISIEFEPILTKIT